MELREIMQKLKEEPSPSELSHMKVYLSAEYALLAQQLSDILSRKPDAWMELRDAEGCTSDKQADRAWDRTPDGREETRIRLKMKGIEKMISAISTRIEVANQELRGNY